MKTYEAVVKKGKLVPSEPVDFPDGTLVQITIKTKGKGLVQIKPDPFENIEELAIETGISDFAKEHDHYLYGAPKVGGKRQGKH